MEKWADIKGYEGKYQVSNLGRIKGLDRFDRLGRPVKGCIIRQSKQRDGYMFVKLRLDGMQKTFRVHRLVAEAFCENPSNLPEVNHKDENKENNTADNLEWCSRSYNNSFGSGLQKRKKQYSIPCAQVKDGEIIATFPSIIEASRKTGTPMIGIQRCLSGIRKHSHGFQWVKL